MKKIPFSNLSPEELEVLKERARALSQSGDEKMAEEGRAHIAFRIGDRGYALSADWIREILPRPQITPIPHTPSFLLGAVNIRGSIVTLTDLEGFLGLGKFKDPQEAPSIILCESSQIRTGILVDEVLECISLQEEDIEPPLVTLEEEKRKYVIGEFRLQDRSFALIEGKTFLNSSHLIIQ